MKLFDLVAAALTERERSVALLLASGVRPYEIAKETRLNIRTVKLILRNLIFKFELWTFPQEHRYILLAEKLNSFIE